MISEQLKDLAAEYILAQESSDEAVAQAHERFVTQLEAEEIGYFDPNDIAHIAEGIVEDSFDLLHHTCGQAVVLDGDQFRIHGGDLAGHLIERCPRCDKPLDAYDLYTNPGGKLRNLLREAGYYPTRDSLALIAKEDQRSSAIEEMYAMSRQLSDGDLLAAYGVIAALLEESKR